MKIQQQLTAVLFLGAPLTLLAGGNDVTLGGAGLGQAAFLALSEDMGAAFSYKALAPIEPQGTFGFDVGVEMGVTSVENAEVWQQVTGDDISNIPVPRLHLHKGLPLDFDIAASYAKVPSSDISLFAWEVRYAFIAGDIAMPAVGVRYSQSNLSGIDDLSFSTSAVELGISKGFAMFTPYAGIGRVWVDSAPDVAGLVEENITLNKKFFGINLNLGLFNMALEHDTTGDAKTVGAKVSFRF
ncbi:MAG: hypothetical protein HQL49_11675 [Gammaproteobacteria bacterium]|nr:hypothetical protein [Gammaproteobacteria bacterium]